jgi:hypothetical protein
MHFLGFAGSRSGSQVHSSYKSPVFSFEWPKSNSTVRKEMIIVMMIDVVRFFISRLVWLRNNFDFLRARSII